MFPPSHLLTRVTLLGLSAFIVACSDSANTTAPTPLVPEELMDAPEVSLAVASPTAAKTYFDQAYATKSSAQKLDLYLPSTGKGPFPVVVWIHGGGWRSGTKSLASHQAVLNLVSAGFAVASVEYRLSQVAKYPAQIQDVKASVRWLRANAGRFNLNPSRVGAWGVSAGGHLAALLGTSNGVAMLSDKTLGNASMSEKVSAVADFFGPISFLDMDSQLLSMGCGKYAGSGYSAPSSPPSLLVGASINSVPQLVKRADPATFLGAGDAKFLIQHGTGDCIVPYKQSVDLTQEIRTLVGAANVTYKQMPGYKHGDSRFLSSANVATVIQFFKTSM
ncbi:MAG: alpha/beta hydrolase [Gemmatimonadaceae bacterium]